MERGIAHARARACVRACVCARGFSSVWQGGSRCLRVAVCDLEEMEAMEEVAGHGQERHLPRQLRQHLRFPHCILPASAASTSCLALKSEARFLFLG